MPLPLMKNYDFNRWVISDTHFFHKNIVKYSQRPENHDDLMFDNWNNTVGTEEKVLHLGDLALGKKEDLILLSGLNGRKELLLGNHDRRGVKIYEEIGFHVLKRSFRASYKGREIVFTHRPEDASIDKLHPKKKENVLVVHGHIHRGMHREGVKGGNFINLSVEEINYTPQWLPDVLDKAILRSSSS